jgi:transposase
MTIVEERSVITGGVDTHSEVHVAAALDPIGGLLGVREFPATAAGYAGLLSWLQEFGDVGVVGVEGTGSYGAGLARYLAAARVQVVEVDRADRQDRRRQGKPDPLDAVSAARGAQSGRAAGLPKGRDGAVEAIRALMVAKRSARNERTQAINQARALILTGPDDLRARLAGHRAAALAEAIAALRPRPGDAAEYAIRVALRELGRRVDFPDGQLERLDELIVPLVTARAPGLLSLYGVGPDTAAMLLVAAGDHPDRLRSEAAWAHMCGVAPIPASSGKVRRHRLNPGGNREANHALWRIVITRMSAHPATRAYVDRRTGNRDHGTRRTIRPRARRLWLISSCSKKATARSPASNPKSKASSRAVTRTAGSGTSPTSQTALMRDFRDCRGLQTPTCYRDRERAA